MKHIIMQEFLHLLANVLPRIVRVTMAITEKSLADQLFPADMDEDLGASILTIPPEQRRLHTDTYDFAISTILHYLEEGNMYVPEFQRRYVWNDAQASRLIESLIIQCPIPVIYLSQDKDEKLSVIDGNQRVKTLQRFVKDEFVLKGLTAYPELEGQLFSGLDVRFQRHILNRTLRCIVITKDTHPQIKFDVFERLNSGAVKLLPQELRHGIYHGRLMEVIEKLARERTWRTKPNFGASGSKRMREEELVLRFFAFHYNLDNYRQPLSIFLNEFAETNKNMDAKTEVEFTDLFRRTMESVNDTYGELAFKVFDKENNPAKAFNAALFDAEMLSLSKLVTNDKPVVIAKKALFMRALGEKFYDERFMRSITRTTSNVGQVKYRVETMKALVQEYA